MTEWVEPPNLVPIGGQWLYAVGIVKDRFSDSFRLRIAKGKIKGFMKRTPKGVLEAFPDNPLDPVSQESRVNIKTAEEWQGILKAAEKWLSKISKSRP